MSDCVQDPIIILQTWMNVSCGVWCYWAKNNLFSLNYSFFTKISHLQESFTNSLIFFNVNYISVLYIMICANELFNFFLIDCEWKWAKKGSKSFMSAMKLFKSARSPTMFVFFWKNVHFSWCEMEKTAADLLKTKVFFFSRVSER